jgi:hypothetical protein
MARATKPGVKMPSSNKAVAREIPRHTPNIRKYRPTPPTRGDKNQHVHEAMYVKRMNTNILGLREDKVSLIT